MLEIIVGGALAISGGIIGTWLQARFSRRAKMGEILAEKRVNACEEAFKRMLDIRASMWGDRIENAAIKFEENANWFVENRLFLSGKFSGAVSGLRLSLSKAARLARIIGKEPGFHESPEKENEMIDKLTETETRSNRLADEALDELLRDMGLTEMTIELPDGSLKRIVIKQNPLKLIGRKIWEPTRDRYEAIVQRKKRRQEETLDDQ
jgi:hypothetical protein